MRSSIRGECLRQALVAFVLVTAGCAKPFDSHRPLSNDAGGGGGAGGGDAGGDTVVNRTDGGSGPAHLTIDQTSYNFGTVVALTPSGDAAFVVTNDGGTSSGKLLVTLAGGAFGYSIKSDRCSGVTLATGTSCSITISLTPMAAGLPAADLSVSATPGGSVTAHLTATAIAAGALQISPASQDFGMVVQNQGSASQTFTISNTGQQASQAITVTLGGTSQAEFQVTADGCTGQTLTANSSCQITVRFGPASAGAKSASLTVSGNPGGSAVAQLAGTGITQGTLTIAPTVRDFGSVQQMLTGASQIFSVQNVGQATTAALSAALAGTNDVDFAITANTCNGHVLTANATCAVTVQFAPLTSGAKLASLSVAGAAGETGVAQLSGVSLASASITITPPSKQYNSVTVNQVASATFVIANPGGVATGIPSVTVAGVTTADGGQFSIPAGSNGCTAAIPAGGSCMISVRFAPTTTGVKNGTLTVTATPGGSAAATLTGTGIAPGKLAISPLNQDFGSVQQGTKGATAVTFTVTNSGASTTGTLQAAIVGSTEFAIASDGCSQTTLAPAATCTVSVTFAPASASPSGTLQITATNPADLTSAGLTGTGLAPAKLSMTPTSASYVDTVLNQTNTASFVVKNTGGVAAGTTTALAASILGTNAADFSVVTASSTCAGTLAAGASCTIVVAFTPKTTGSSKTASLNVTATPGMSAVASLGGNGVSAALLTLVTAASNSPAFGGVVVGGTKGETFVVTNTGQQASSGLLISLTNTAGPGFSVLSGAAGDCVANASVPGGSSCNVRVQFAPTGSGAQSATLAVSAATGGSPPALALSGTGLTAATLSASVTSVNLGNVEVGVGASTSVVITNNGGVATGTPTLTNSDATELTVVTNGCAAAIGPGLSCTISILFDPSTGGARTGTITVSVPGSSVGFTVTATGSYRLTITKSGTGTGTVTSSPAGLNCGATCSALFPGSTMVTIQARTTNGSASFFSGYAGGGCSTARDCVVQMVAPIAVTASFKPMTNNLIFMSSTGFANNLGGAAAYDAKCNAAATAAGINDAAGGASYVAVTSDSSSLFTTRIGTTARGWVRMDGLPFGDTIASIFNLTNSVVLNPIRYDETGVNTNNATAPTGTFEDGEVTNNCLSFSTTASTAEWVGGSAENGPFSWLDSTGSLCGGTPPVICMGKTKTAAIAPVVIAGRKIWLSNGPFTVGGGMTPNQMCQSQLPAGVTTAAAMIATTTQTAASVLSMSMNYVRPDGTLVGSGALIAAGGTLLSGIWQSADGMYRHIPPFDRAWTGAATLNTLGTLANTCGNWVDATQAAGGVGWFESDTPFWWTFGTAGACNNTGFAPAGLYCVQTAP